MSPPEIVGPASSYYVSQRLRLHFVDWGNEAKPPLLLVHGGKDHARSWDFVARALRSDYHVIVPDLRGHGDSAWAQGSTYTLPEYVLDIAQLVEVLGLAPLSIVGHSMGAAVSLYYTGVYPEKVRKLVAIEGMGAPPELRILNENRELWEMTTAWIDAVRSGARRQPRHYATIDEAAARMRQENPNLTPEQAHHLTVHGVARNEDGSFSWKFDNASRPLFPQRLAPAASSASGSGSPVRRSSSTAATAGTATPRRTAAPPTSRRPASSRFPAPATGSTTTSSKPSSPPPALFSRSRELTGTRRELEGTRRELKGTRRELKGNRRRSAPPSTPAA
jgi:pimeloyl-ACP methyl ester carboxylesterase